MYVSCYLVSLRGFLVRTMFCDRLVKKNIESIVYRCMKIITASFLIYKICLFHNFSFNKILLNNNAFKQLFAYKSM